MSEHEDWVSITEAAERLSASGDVVDRSSLSRYVSRFEGALEKRRSGKETQIEFGALKAHRAENIRVRETPARPSPHNPRRIAGSQSDGQARKANADADLREMELAKRRGQLTVTSEVGQAGADAVALMSSAFDRAVEPAAAAAAVKYGWDERKLRLELKAFARTGIEAFNRQIRERLDRARRESAAEDVLDMGEAAGALQ